MSEEIYRSSAAAAVAKALPWVCAVPVLGFAGWLASTSDAGAFGAFFLFVVGLLVGAIPYVFVVAMLQRPFMTNTARDADRAASRAVSEKARAEREAANTPLSEVSVTQWRGLAHMTRAAEVRASCLRCGERWKIEGKVANTIADAQNLGNRLIRGGTRTEQLGATFTPGASGRRIAAGLESERQQRELGAILRLALCPGCGQLDRVRLHRD